MSIRKQSSQSSQLIDLVKNTIKDTIKSLNCFD